MKHQKSNAAKIFAWVLAAFILIMILIIVAEVILESVIKNRIESTVNAGGKIYHISVQKVNLSFFTSSFNVSGIQISTDTSSLKPGIKDSIGFLELKGEAHQLEIKNIHWIDALFEKKLLADEIILSGMQLSSVQHSPRKALKAAKKQLQFLVPFPIAVNQVRLNIDSVDLKNNYRTTSKNDLIVTNGEIVFSPATLNHNDTFTIQRLKKVDINLKKVKYISNDSLYTFKIENVRYDDTSKAFAADSIQLLPNYGEEAFAHKHNVESDRIKILVPDITIDGFRMLDYLKSKKIIAQQVNIEGFDIHVFRDKRMPDDHSKKPMPQQLLYRYHHLVKIDSFNIKNGFAEYKEIAERANDASHIFFNHLNACITNVTNDSIYKTENDTIQLQGSALLMDKSNLAITMRMPIYNASNLIYCNGSLGALKAEDLNPFTKNNMFVTLTAGKINSLHYHFTEDNVHASGTLVMLYDSLNLALINKNTKDTSGLKEKILSFFAKKMIIEPSNPFKGKPVREGIIEYDRNDEKFIFNYTWKSILSGLKSTIGITQNASAKKNH